MLQSYLAKKRALYYRNTYEYKRRRDLIRLQYGVSNGKAAPAEYHERVRKLNNKIAWWSKQIKAIDKITTRLNNLINKVEEFTGYKIMDNNVGNNQHSYNNSRKLTRAIYYKYGIESGLGTPIQLRSMILSKRPSQPQEYRSWLTNSFKTVPENKITWLAFKQFIQTK